VYDLRKLLPQKLCTKEIVLRRELTRMVASCVTAEKKFDAMANRSENDTEEILDSKGKSDLCVGGDSQFLVDRRKGYERRRRVDHPRSVLT
jgi:hypothetical protein